MGNTKTLAGAVPIVAKALGNKYGVNVRFGGSPATNGDTIWLPDLDPDNERVATLTYGHLDHEAAHVRFTDFEAHREIRADRYELHKELYNALEDVRIDKAMAQAYPGTAHNRARLVATLVDEGRVAVADDQQPAPAIFTRYAFLRLQVDVLGRPVTELAERQEEVFRATFPKGVATRLQSMLLEIGEAESSWDTVRLAGRIITMLEDEQDKADDSDGDDAGDQQQGGQEGDQQGTQGNSGQDPSEANADGSGGPDDQSDGSGGGSSSDVEADGEASDGSSDGKQKDDGQDPEAGQDSDSDPNGDSSQSGQDQGGPGGDGAGQGGGPIQQVLEAETGEAEGTDLGQMVAQELEQAAQDNPFGTVHLASEANIPGDTGFGARVANVRAHSAKLRARLAGLVQATQRKQPHSSRFGRKAEARNLYRLQLNDPRVFRRVEERKAVNTAVQVLLDRSGSMRSRIDLAAESALALGLAIDQIPSVGSQVAAFPAEGHSPDEEGVIPLKRFQERAGNAAQRFGVGSNGGTPLASALWWTGLQFLQRPEKRRILFVITDGMPYDPEQSRDIAMRLERELGVEILGIGIGEMEQALFHDAKIIQSMEELPQAAFAMLQNRLTRMAS